MFTFTFKEIKSARVDDSAYKSGKYHALRLTDFGSSRKLILVSREMRRSCTNINKSGACSEYPSAGDTRPNPRYHVQICFQEPGTLSVVILTQQF